MKVNIIDKQQKWLRFLLPFPIGIIAYILILLVFDSLAQLGTNFFSQEVAITIFLAFLLLEGQRLLLNAIDKYFPIPISKEDAVSSMLGQKMPSHSLRIFIVSLLSVLFAIILISAVVSIYFSMILLIRDYTSELIVFIGVYGILAILYAIIHVSTSFLAIHKQIHYRQEKELRKGMESDLEKFKMQINPQLLYDGLENLISIVHSQPKLAEQFVNHLSRIYRYNLDNRHVELVDLKQELQLTTSLLHILNVKHNNAIEFKHQLPEDWYQQQIIPGTISTLIQEAVGRSIINEYQPMIIQLKQVDGTLVFSCANNPKIALNGKSKWNISHINKAYAFFNGNKLEIEQNNQQLNINIPLFEIEEE